MHSLRHSTRVIAISILAAGFVAACDGGITSIPEPEKRDAWADVTLAGMRTTSISVRAPEGMIRTYTDSGLVSMRHHSGGLQITTNRGKREFDPRSASISRDDGSLSLPRVEGRITGRTVTDSLGNEFAVAFVGGSDARGAAPPEFLIVYRNGKPIHAMRSTYQQVQGKWVAVGSRSTVFDTVTREVLGEVRYNVRRNSRLAEYRTGRAKEVGDVTSGTPGLSATSGAVANSTAATCEENSGLCTKLLFRALDASALAITMYQVFLATELACLNGNIFACAAVDKAMLLAEAAASVAQGAWSLYRTICGSSGGGEMTHGSVDPTDASEVIELIKRNTPAFYDCGGGGDDPQGYCYLTWGKIEISYDGGASWQTLWEGVITVCDDAL